MGVEIGLWPPCPLPALSPSCPTPAKILKHEWRMGVEIVPITKLGEWGSLKSIEDHDHPAPSCLPLPPPCPPAPNPVERESIVFICVSVVAI